MAGLTWAAVGMVAGAMLLCGTAAGQSLTIIEPAPGFLGSTATALSDDGTAASGVNLGPSPRLPGFRWTRAGGREDFGLEPGMPTWTRGLGISGNGRVVVGDFYDSTTGLGGSYRYAGNGTIQALGSIAGLPTSQAIDASRDGSVVVGTAYGRNQVPQMAYRWTEAGGMQGLGFARPGHAFSNAYAVSSDGNVIVGTSVGFNDGFGFRWTPETGMQTLQGLPDHPNFQSAAYGMNSDGSIIVGDVGEAAIWRNGIPEGLGRYNGYETKAIATSDDGSVIMCSASFPLPTGVVWTGAAGMELLPDYLSRNGVSVPAGWTFRGNTVSPDGLTIAGSMNRNGIVLGYIATIPAPPTVFLMLFSLCHARRRRPR
jgi:uncharacterized membrane protein